MKSMNRFFVLATLVFVAAGCASKQTDKAIDQKLAADATQTGGQLQSESKDLIETGKFTADQKAKLRTLRSDMETQLASLHEESLKLRSLLLKEVMATKYNAKEVKSIEARLKTNSDKRLSLIFKSVEKANAIIGRTSPDDDRANMVRSLMFSHDEKNL